MTRPIRDLPSLRAARASLAGKVALVPTMGALHDGHLQLVAEAKRRADHVVASIYVNPLQFNDSADLRRYPRDEPGDLAALSRAGCDLAWLPNDTIMVPPGDATVIEPAGPAERWEGAARPGHFRGVATVVAKLFGQVRPDLALFGEKDWQQLQVIRRTVADLFLPVTVCGVPTVREADGLAMSSRNRFLSSADRAIASRLPRILDDVARGLTIDAAVFAVLDAGRAALADAGMVMEYLALVDAESLRVVDRIAPDQCYRLLAAVGLGSVRLLDNRSVSCFAGAADSG